MEGKLSTRFYFRGSLVLTVLTAGILYLIWLSNFNVKSVRVLIGRCPSKTKTTIHNLYGIDLELQKALNCRFAERRKRLQRACRKTGPYRYRPQDPFEKSTDGRITFRRHNLTICTLQKIGSQFWRRYFTVVGKEIENEGFETSKLHRNDYLDTVKVVFVREPYSRLFSGFIDKLFSPNPAYWKTLGVDVIQIARKHGGVSDRECGADVTFAEFVEYILLFYHNNLDFDDHFKPIHFRCEFCKTEYDYIGKMETFLEDVIFVSHEVGLLKYNRTREFLLKEGFDSAKEIQRNARSLFQLRLNGLEYCRVSLRQALKLTWRRWQIRGFIETKFDFPLEADDISIKWQRFYELAMIAHRSSDKRKLTNAKMAALRQAYSTLSLKLKLGLKEMLLPQFVMFGYDAMPEKVFGNYSKSSVGFDFLETQTITGGV